MKSQPENRNNASVPTEGIGNCIKNWYLKKRANEYKFTINTMLKQKIISII